LLGTTLKIEAKTAYSPHHPPPPQENGPLKNGRPDLKTKYNFQK